MIRRFPKTAAIAAGAVAVAGVAAAGVLAANAGHPAAPQAAQLSRQNVTHRFGTPKTGRHSLLISVDGLHTSDLQKFIARYPNSNLAKLSRRGTSYSHALTTFPSDSFPGMLALATGGTPKQTGVYYDVSYNRATYDPSNTTCSGAPGAVVTYDESIDQSLAHLSGTASGTGGANASAINPANLPRAIVNGTCQPVYPRNYLQSNTIFEVAHNAGLYTAWSDKHPSYELLNGNDTYNTAGSPSVNDLYTPEINSTVNANQLKVPYGPETGQYVPAVGDYTSSVDGAMAYDNTKVDAVVNQINGLTSTGGTPAGGNKVPSIFGMNFQSVSVGQKLPVAAYYNDGRTFSPQLLTALGFIDQSVGRFVGALTAHHLLDSTQIIITAKHGQSPKNRGALHRIPESDGTTNSLVGFVNAHDGQPLATDTADDVGLLWWQNPSAGPGGVVAALNADAATTNVLSVKHVYAGSELNARFGTPTATANVNDLGNRVPDVVIQPQHGVIYSTSLKKVAEHGGGSNDDRNVALLVVDGWAAHGARTVRTGVSTTQVAPTILTWLGLDPSALTAAVQAHTTVLPQPHSH